MNEYFRRKFQNIFLLSLVFAFPLISVQAQCKNAPKKNSASSKSPKNFKAKSKKISDKIFSAGVLNGKAIDLVRPQFPRAAKAVNVYGVVSVLVLIDESGKVVKAEVKSGHPLLRASAIEAAFQSKFEPVTLSGEPIKVEGIIIYKFVPDQWNWFEIGYTINSDSHFYYSIKTLSETLPFDLEAEKQMLNQMPADENGNETIKALISMIHQRLIYQTKSSWLFETGLALAEVQKNFYTNKESLKTSESYQNLKNLVTNPPADINQRLIERMQKIILLIEENNAEPFEDWQKFVDIFPYVGN